jgi:dUTP pyrophosphatase
LISIKFQEVGIDLLHQKVQSGFLLHSIMGREHLNIQISKLHDDAILPTQGSEQAAGWDLYALETTTVKKNATVMIPTGLAVAIPTGWEGQIRCRSSLGKRGMMLPNGVGTIDSDYRGELKVLASFIGEGDEFVIEKGERIAQLLFAPVPTITFVEVEREHLGQTDRGTGGFGSTGQF